MIGLTLRRLLWLTLTVALYVSLDATRRTIFGADLSVVTSEFLQLGMSEYNLREPLYWFSGKLLTEMLGDPWAAVVAMDIIASGLFLVAIWRTNMRSYFIFALLLSPMVLLGFCNIHRQLIGFLVWIFIERFCFNKSTLKTAPLHIIPFLIHSSMGLMSFVYFFSQAVGKKQWKIVGAMAVTSLVFLLLFSDVILTLFRGGAEITTGISLYIAWAALIFILMISVGRPPMQLLIFYILGCVCAIYLFLASAETSGSRFFMLIITTVAVWLMASDKLSSDDIKARSMRAAIALAICIPTFTSNFSQDILRATISGKPYGVDQ